jgi:hypothetical protein
LQAKYKMAGTFSAACIPKQWERVPNWWEQVLGLEKKILIKIPAGKRYGIGIITKFCGILSRFPNQAPTILV